MLKVIGDVAWWFGFTTWYHVSFMVASEGSVRFGDACISVSPWLRGQDGIRDLQEHVMEHENLERLPSILSITRIRNW